MMVAILRLSTKAKMLLISAAVSVVVIAVTFQIAAETGDDTIRYIGIIGGGMTGIAPLLVLSLREGRRKESIDRNLPLFLLALVSSVSSGASLIRAIEEAAERNMGSLTPELKNLRANISWGMPLQEAFENFAERVNTVMGKRVIVLLQLAVQSGGQAVATLELMQKHLTEIQDVERERKASLQPYIYVIYIAFVIFLAVTVLLAVNFFAEISLIQQRLIEVSEKSEVPLGMFGALLGVDVNQLNQVMFTMALMEAVFGGMAAGKIGEGRFIAGIKHVVIMLVMAVVIFTMVGIGL